MGLKLPPEFVNTPAHDVFNMELPDSVYRTLAVLHGLAWQTKGERTPPTTVLELATLRGLRERQMYTHLRTLKKLRRIRVDKLGRGLMVIYPLRWESGAALPPDEPSTQAEAPDEITAKNCSNQAEEEVGWDDTGPQPRSERPITAINCNSTAKNCSKQPKAEPDLDDPGPQPGSGQEFTAINCSKSESKRPFTAKNCSNHVVVDSCLKDSDSDSEQQQHEQQITAKNCSKTDPDGSDSDESGSERPFTAKNCSKQDDVDPDLDNSSSVLGSPLEAEPEFTAKNCSNNADAEPDLSDTVPESTSQGRSDQGVTAKNCSKLIEAIAAIFVEAGDSPDVGRDKAAKLTKQHGVECCERQLSYFPRRCELARASEEGLRNPSGLFIRSVQDDWTAPPQTQKKPPNPPNTWYTPEEYDDLIEH